MELDSNLESQIAELLLGSTAFTRPPSEVTHYSRISLGRLPRRSGILETILKNESIIIWAWGRMVCVSEAALENSPILD